MANGNCARCEKPLDGAHPTYCKLCFAAYAREQRVKHPGRQAATDKAWRERNPEKWRRIKRLSNVKREYGLAAGDYDALLDAQNGACAICGKVFVATQRGGPHVDHCHDGDAVRGLLCNGCNLGLGKFNDDPELLIAAAAYLFTAKSGKVEV